MSKPLPFVAIALVVAACSTPAEMPGTDAGVDPSVDAGVGTDTGSVADTGSVDDTGTSATGSTTIGPADRRARLVAPTTLGTGPAPLLVLLHGYSATAAVQDTYLGVTRAAAPRGLWVILPDGTVDSSGKRYWNAHGCCNFANVPVDDVAYLRGLVQEAMSIRDIDPARVYFFGHSNGGFMSYRIACELGSEVAAIAVLAGSDAQPDAACMPSQPVSVLHLHGTSDTTIPYGGGNVGLGAFPGAVAMVGRWAARAGCGATPTDGTPLDLESTLPGAETTPHTFTGCDPGLDVRLLEITGASHIPTFTTGAIGTEVLDWLLAHHR